jgi:putative membrane protein
VMEPMMAGMGLWALLVIVAVVTVVLVAVLGSVWLTRRLRQDAAVSTVTTEPDNARELLRRRYAAGEIDDEEYERRLSALTWR